jgi:phosphoglycolate phosphatase-like HAD superfamily hydrolase
MNKNEKIIIFDFDGVIANSFHVAFEVNRLSRPALTEDRYQAMFNTNINDAKHTDPVVNEIDFFTEFGKRFQNLGINSEVKESVIQLSKQFPLFIVSSTINSIISDYLTRHNIRSCFEDILGYDIEKSKVKKFNMLFKANGYLPENAAFLTDTAGDIAEARESKINFIVGILGGYQNKKTLQAGQPDAIVENMSDFFNLIQNKFA